MAHTVIGTAGHIDHGKTLLVKALTGMDTDQAPEERARGITIELGFAFLGDRATIIDVPGHERFVKTMVAGVSTIDVAMLVIAADDGVMPQSREHLDVLRLLGVERVADREAVVIDIRPKDRYRYGFRLAADRRTGLLLKSELLDSGGTTLEQIVYTRLELPDSIPDEALKPRISGAGFTRYEAASPPAAGRDPAARTQEWEVGWLPAGFRMTGESYAPIRPGRVPVDHRVYGDGLVSLSVFIERVSGPGDRLEGRSSVGAVNAFSRIVEGFQLSVVGEVPGATVEKVAASIVKR